MRRVAEPTHVRYARGAEAGMVLADNAANPATLVSTGQLSRSGGLAGQQQRSHQTAAHRQWMAAVRGSQRCVIGLLEETGGFGASSGQQQAADGTRNGRQAAAGSSSSRGVRQAWSFRVRVRVRYQRRGSPFAVRSLLHW